MLLGAALLALQLAAPVAAAAPDPPAQPVAAVSSRKIKHPGSERAGSESRGERTADAGAHRPARVVLQPRRGRQASAAMQNVYIAAIGGGLAPPRIPPISPSTRAGQPLRAVKRHSRPGNISATRRSRSRSRSARMRLAASSTAEDGTSRHGSRAGADSHRDAGRAAEVRGQARAARREQPPVVSLRARGGHLRDGDRDRASPRVAQEPCSATRIASYVATSRLHDNRHYLSDVVFGAAVGSIAGRTVVHHASRLLGGHAGQRAGRWRGAAGDADEVSVAPHAWLEAHVRLGLSYCPRSDLVRLARRDVVDVRHRLVLLHRHRRG